MKIFPSRFRLRMQIKSSPTQLNNSIPKHKGHNKSSVRLSIFKNLVGSRLGFGEGHNERLPLAYIDFGVNYANLFV